MLDRLWRLLIVLTGICVCLLARVTCAIGGVLAPCVLHGCIKMRDKVGRARDEEGTEVDGRGKKMGRLRELNKEKQTPSVGRRVICLFKGASLEI